MKIVKVSTRGRITIPKELRVKYSLKAGMKINFISEGNEIVLVPAGKKKKK